jgi:ribonuclease HI
MAKIYTDGSCLKNPNGPSGWAFILLENNEEWNVSGGESSSTNNRMELIAVIEALNFVQNTNYTIYTDSKLTLNCAKGIWKRKANLDLWDEYNFASGGKNLNWVWVKAHNGNKYNEIVDKLARDEAKKYKK